MISWLDSFFGRVAGSIGQQISNAVHWAVRAVAAVIFAVFGLVGRAWRYLAVGIYNFVAWVERFAREVVTFAAYVIRVWGRDLLHYAQSWISWLYNTLISLWGQVQAGLADLWNGIRKAYSDIEHWVISQVWDPLYAYARQIESDLIKWGYTAWYWVTHPDKLAAALFWYLVGLLEQYAWEVGGRLGGFITALIARNLTRFIALIEDIVMAVF